MMFLLSKTLDKFYFVYIIVIYNVIPIKTVKGIRHNRFKLQRVGVWCEPMFTIVCIAHPRVACLIM